MSAVIDAARGKVQKAWSFTKKTLTLLGLWGLVFSLVTIGRLRVAFDYDDTLVFSTPAYDKAFHSGALPFSGRFWSVVNRSYDVERPKLVTNLMAWAFRLIGFQITILAGRPAEDSEALHKEWRHLTSRFIFAPDDRNRIAALGQGHHVIFFWDSDSDIQQARRAGVPVVRIRRSLKSSYKEDYHPGTLRELVLPLSEY